MCLILVAWNVHPQYPLIVAANRDEFYARPSAPLAFWNDAPQVLAGRDLEAGGTWLGITRDRRFAALTNIRDFTGGPPRQDAPSRGQLTSRFLLGDATCAAYVEHLQSSENMAAYNGFNLLLADASQLAWINSIDSTARLLPSGIYGLSNHLLDTPWPKLVSAKAAFSSAIDGLDPANERQIQAQIFHLLADDEIAPDDRLPTTGVSLEWERRLSAIFVRSADYGTRASTVVFVRRDGSIAASERSFGIDGAPGKTVNIAL